MNYPTTYYYYSKTYRYNDNNPNVYTYMLDNIEYDRVDLPEHSPFNNVDDIFNYLVSIKPNNDYLSQMYSDNISSRIENFAEWYKNSSIIDQYGAVQVQLPYVTEEQYTTVQIENFETSFNSNIVGKF